MLQDNRQFEREEKFFIVNIQPNVLNANYYLGLTKNISPDGFSFESRNYDLKAGDCLEFFLKDPQGNLNVPVAGKIIWKKTTDFECLVGVQFLGIDEETRRKIIDNVPENQQVDEVSVDQDNGPTGTINIKEEVPIAQEEDGAILQAISRAAERLDLDEAGTETTNEGVTSVMGMDSESPVHLDNKAAVFHESIFGREAYQGDDALIYKSDHDINWGISEKERMELQNSEREKARKTHWYIAAVTVIVLIAFAVFMRPGTINKDRDLNVHEDIRMEAARTTADEVLTDMNQGHNEMQDNISPVETAESRSEAIEGTEQAAVSPEKNDALSIVETTVPAIVQGNELPVMDLRQEPPVNVKEEAPISGIAEKMEIVVAPQTVHEKLENSSRSVHEKAAISEVHVNEPESLKTETDHAVDKQAATAESLPVKTTTDQNNINNVELSGVEESLDPLIEHTIKAEDTEEIEAPAESPTDSGEQQVLDAPVEEMNVVETELIVEEPSTDESDKGSEQQILSAADEEEKENDFFVGSSRNGYMTYLEPFDDNSNEWKQFDTYAASAQIREGEYYLKNKRGSGPHLVFHGHDFPFKSDFLIEVSIRAVSTPGSFAYGLVFGAQSVLDNYTFQVINNEGFSIRKYEKGVLNQLAEGNFNKIYSNLHNVLRIARQGDKIRFFINGEYIAGLSDLTLSGNRLGFIIEGQSEVSISKIYFRVKTGQ